MSKYKIILSGGGTGGHIYPAISIANELKLRFPNSEFLFKGSNTNYLYSNDKTNGIGFSYDSERISYLGQENGECFGFPVRCVKD